MPGEAFYQGLTLVEQVQKFIDHHYDPKTRHISAYEAPMLDRAQERIEQTIEIAREQAAQDLRAVYEAFLQVYLTLVSGESRVVAVNSLPTWQLADPIAVLGEAGLAELVRDPSPSQVQAVVAALMTSPESASALAERYAALASDVRLVERLLDDEALAVVNRMLYEPSIVAENSWADVASLLDHLGKTKTKGTPVVVFGGVMMATDHVIVAFLAGGSVIALQLLQNVAEGMAPGLKALGEKLTASWRTPAEPGSGESPAT